MSSLSGKVAIVTGASSGIGRATARLFAREGAKVVVGARREAELATLAREIEAQGGEATALAGDVQSEQYAMDLVAAAVEAFGGLDVAVNNAGMTGPTGPSTGITEEEWTGTLSVNLTGAFLGAKHQIPEVVKRVAGRSSSPRAWSATLSASLVSPPMRPASRGSSASPRPWEYGPQGVRVNALLPGAVDTPMYREFASTAEQRVWLTNLHALKRIGRPEQLARAALYLASDSSAFVTGTASLVDGGVRSRGLEREQARCRPRRQFPGRQLTKPDHPRMAPSVRRGPATSKEENIVTNPSLSHPGAASHAPEKLKLIDPVRFGPWALVTGASSGIGREFVRQLAAHGLNVALASRRLADLEAVGHEIAEQWGVEHRSIEVDLTKADFLLTIDNATSDLDIGLVISNAGDFARGEFLTIEREHLHAMVRVNVLANLDISHHFGQRLVARKRGGLVLVGAALAASDGVPFMANPAATKAYVHSLGRALHIELAEQGVTVTVLMPGTTATPALEKLGIDVDKLPTKPMGVEQCVSETLVALNANRATIVPGRPASDPG
jgi:NAD(P)-dependent dehydrogenase (short-subunit alcohol dehydrogenase family)